MNNWIDRCNELTEQLEKLQLEKNKFKDVLKSTQEANTRLWDRCKATEAENKNLLECKRILEDFRDTVECRQTWVEEMHGTITEVLAELEEKK